MKPQKIILGEKTYPISFGLLSTRKLEEITGQPIGVFLSELQEKLSKEIVELTPLLKVVYAGLYAGARISGEPFTLSEEEVVILLDQQEDFDFLHILEQFNESMPTGSSEKKRHVGKSKKIRKN